MENREQQILSEIKSMMASIRSQLDLLDAKMAELQQSVGPEDGEVVPIDLDITEVVVESVLESAPEPIPVVDDLPFEDLPETAPEEETQEEPEEEPVEEPEEDMAEDLPEVEPDDDLPIFAEPEPVYVSAPAAPKVKPAVIDAMTAHQAWRTDMPGTSVKDIRSAISLNDRIIFINYLFGEDPLAFQDALTKINVMTSLDEVVDYVVAEHQDWDLESDMVYRFMMAVRRRIR